MKGRLIPRRRSKIVGIGGFHKPHPGYIYFQRKRENKIENDSDVNKKKGIKKKTNLTKNKKKKKKQEKEETESEEEEETESEDDSDDKDSDKDTEKVNQTGNGYPLIMTMPMTEKFFGYSRVGPDSRWPGGKFHPNEYMQQQEILKDKERWESMNRDLQLEDKERREALKRPFDFSRSSHGCSRRRCY